MNRKKLLIAIIVAVLVAILLLVLEIYFYAHWGADQGVTVGFGEFRCNQSIIELHIMNYDSSPAENVTIVAKNTSEYLVGSCSIKLIPPYGEGSCQIPFEKIRDSRNQYEVDLFQPSGRDGMTGNFQCSS
jgi:hypothetical protein